MKIGSLHIIETNGKRIFACECGYMLCSVTENFKGHAIKNDRPLSDMQPAYLTAQTSNKFVLREYICPKCGALFEVDVVLKDKPEDIPTMLLK